MKQPVFVWCCETWWLTNGGAHEDDCRAGRSQP
ncbi:hypothetical protein FHS36_002147 [Streptomyces eurocidicus]|uniref:Uncharacterized protein n=1 Tax=Streptomyces eurocidicus TaxID=66423 RepID=A0A7W8F263_STREU|nr:hypothetical protein [Streptomyces eurocidicus]